MKRSSFPAGSSLPASTSVSSFGAEPSHLSRLISSWPCRSVRSVRPSKRKKHFYNLFPPRKFLIFRYKLYLQVLSVFPSKSTCPLQSRGTTSSKSQWKAIVAILFYLKKILNVSIPNTRSGANF